MIEVTLFPETKITREIEFRADRYGLYLNCCQSKCLVAGISFQWPTWLQRLVNGEESARHLVAGLRIYSWDAQECIDYWQLREKSDG